MGSARKRARLEVDTIGLSTVIVAHGGGSFLGDGGVFWGLFGGARGGRGVCGRYPGGVRGGKRGLDACY